MSAFLAELGRALFWAQQVPVAMIWLYYDESGEYDDGTLLNMTVGGCAAPFGRWESFTTAWCGALAAEGLDHFHMTDFEAWQPPFDFYLANGERDWAKHRRLLNALLDILLESIDGLYGYGAVSMYLPDRQQTHNQLMEDCMLGAVKDAVLRVWMDYEEPINLVFAKQPHFPEHAIRKYVEFYDYGEAKDRIGSISTADIRNVPPLQAADLFAYEMARAQRRGRPERYPYQRMLDGAKERGLRWTMQWGPIRHQRIRLSGQESPK